ncbi:MAG: DUF4105 domain-containing protein [Paludibacteraceae bacterium]|nr:DUF4105 domain-containing protein [Paludibacteraceae bacterium]
MAHNIRTYLAMLLLACSTMMHAQQLSDQARIILVSCTPGDELYTRYGHTAIRVCDPQNDLDIVFNYGIFSFYTEHFYWKFVRGETWYELGATEGKWFMLDYGEEGRPVYEQELNLTAEQRDNIWHALVENYKPENREYLYNFVFDNCATRPYLLIKNALGDTIRSTYSGYTGQTYRCFLRHYTGAHSWYNAGINLLFGPKADQPMTSEQRLFLPEELMRYLDEAKLSDGTPLVSKSNCAPFQIEPTPWYATWELGLVLYFLLVLSITLLDRKLGRWCPAIDILAAIPYCLLLLIVCFLTFFSCHPLVGFGWRLLIIPITHACARIVYFIR